MFRKVLILFVISILIQGIAFSADGFPLRGTEKMWLTPPPAGQRANESTLKLILYRAGGRMHPSYRNRFYPEVSNREYYDCSYYKYCDCRDMRFSRCWQCRHWLYYGQYTD